MNNAWFCSLSASDDLLLILTFFFCCFSANMFLTLINVVKHEHEMSHSRRVCLNRKSFFIKAWFAVVSKGHCFKAVLKVGSKVALKLWTQRFIPPCCQPTKILLSFHPFPKSWTWSCRTGGSTSVRAIFLSNHLLISLVFYTEKHKAKWRERMYL